MQQLQGQILQGSVSMSTIKSEIGNSVDSDGTEYQGGSGGFSSGGGRFGGGGGGGGGRYSDIFEHFRKMFIGALNYETTEDSLRAHFEKWGEIVDCVVIRNPTTNRSRGFGFITYKDASSIDHAQANRPHTIDNIEVETKRAMPTDPGGASNRESFTTEMFVEGLKDGTTEEQVRECFLPFGEIEHVDIVVDKATGKFPGFAVVLFKDYDSVDKAVLVKWHDLNTTKVKVTTAVSQDQMEGGGRGGGSGRGSRSSDSSGSSGFGSYKSTCGVASADGFGSNYAGDYCGGPVKSGGYSARAQGPYGVLKRHDLNTMKVEVKTAVSQDQMEGASSTGGYSAGGYSTGGYSAGGYSAGGYSTGGYSAGGYSAGGYSAGGYSAGGNGGGVSSSRAGMGATGGGHADYNNIILFLMLACMKGLQAAFNSSVS